MIHVTAHAIDRFRERIADLPDETIRAMLSTCLALVKPVGMSAEDAQAWLRVAARDAEAGPAPARPLNGSYT